MKNLLAFIAAALVTATPAAAETPRVYLHDVDNARTYPLPSGQGEYVIYVDMTDLRLCGVGRRVDSERAEITRKASVLSRRLRENGFSPRVVTLTRDMRIDGADPAALRRC